MRDELPREGAGLRRDASVAPNGVGSRPISRMAAVFDAAPIGVGAWSVDGTLLHANPVLCDLLATDLSTLVGQPIERVLVPADVARVRDRFEEIWRGERNAFSCTFSCVAGGGGPLLVRAEITAVYGSTGWPEYLLSQIFDFTSVDERDPDGPGAPDLVEGPDELHRLRAELKVVQREHAEVQRLFHTVTEAGPVAVVRLDDRGRITYANGRWADILDDHRDRLSGFSWRRLLDAAQMDEIVAHGRASIESGEAFSLRVAVNHRNEAMLDPDEIPPAPHWAILRVSPVFSAGGAHDGWVGTLTDVSAEVAADSRADQLAQALDAGSDFLMIAERTGAISYANLAARQSLGVQTGEGGASPSFVMDMLDADSFEAWHELVHPTLVHGGVWRGELTVRLVSGQQLPVSAQFNARYDADGRLDTIFAVARDISDIKVAEHQLHQMATHDYLTGMPNRVLLYDRLDQALARFHRYRQAVALLYVDLDRFKQVNDEHGHHIGDSVLRCVADRIHELVRESDTAARVGGDEFCLLIEGISDVKTLKVIADRLIGAISAPILLGDVRAEIGASVGLVLVDDGCADVDALMALADTAMYRAKATGRGTSHVHDPTEPT